MCAHHPARRRLCAPRADAPVADSLVVPVSPDSGPRRRRDSDCTGAISPGRDTPLRLHPVGSAVSRPGRRETPIGRGNDCGPRHGLRLLRLRLPVGDPKGERRTRPRRGQFPAAQTGWGGSIRGPASPPLGPAQVPAVHRAIARKARRTTRFSRRRRGPQETTRQDARRFRRLLGSDRAQAGRANRETAGGLTSVSCRAPAVDSPTQTRTRPC